MEDKSLLPFEKTPLPTTLNVKSVITVHYFKYGQKFNFIGEQHDFWEIVYIDSGEARITAENEVFTLSQGEIYFHKPNEYHAISTDDFANSIIVSFECHSPAMTALESKKLSLSETEKVLLRTIVTESSHCFSDKLSDVHLRKLNRSNLAPFASEQMPRLPADARNDASRIRQQAL